MGFQLQETQRAWVLRVLRPLRGAVSAFSAVPPGCTLTCHMRVNVTLQEETAQRQEPSPSRPPEPGAAPRAPTRV